MSAVNPSLKKVLVNQVRLGMHLHALEGAWLEHPFWKTQFVLRDPGDLQKLRASKVREVWINTDKGLDLASAGVGLRNDAPPAAAAATALGGAAALMARPDIPAAPPPAPATPRAAMAEELHQAAQICNRSREAVSSMFAEVRLGHALNTEHCLPLVGEVTESVFRNPGALVSLARLKTADDYSYMHSVAVCALMVALARQLGQDDDACREAGLAGLLHDLGKAVMPLEILNKPGRLTDAEFDVIRTHPQRGHELLMEAECASEAAMEVCLHHHEHMDGSGYPHRQSGEAISLLARMGAVCDVYDAITSNRPYKAGWDPAESIARMASWKGHFDPTVLRAFVRSLGIYPNGALVRLASGRLAVVMAQNPAALTAPVVKAFFDTRTEMPIGASVLDLAAANATDRIIDREPPGRWQFANLDALWAGEAVIAAKRGR